MSLPPPPSDDDVVVDPLLKESDAPISVPDSNDASEGGKLKMILQLIKRSLGVKDLAAMRISLPASLMEPVPNLEYWQYLDRPDLFAAINDSTDPFERMLAVIRWTLSKDLKFVHGKVVKPYNSVLGEHFRSHWVVKPVTYPSDPNAPPILHSHLTAAAPSLPPSETTSTKSSKKTAKSSSKVNSLGKSAPVTPLATGSAGTGELGEVLAADISNLSLGARSSNSDQASETLRVVFLTEQVCHHPPISSFYYSVPDKGVVAVGVDQMSAKVSPPASVRVVPGDRNKGIFVSLTSGPGQGEKYNVTHPMAVVTGLLRGSPYVTMTDSTYITATPAPGETRHLRAIIEYKEESWIGRAQFLLEGAIFEYDPESEDHLEWTKVKHVPKERVVATFDGSWQKRVYWKRAGESTKNLLIDLSTMLPVPKIVRPLEDQIPFESQKLWETVTSNLLSKNYNEATKQKQIIEQAQRDRAAERKKTGQEFVPVYFLEDISSGQPELTDAGRKAIEAELALQ
ncbi:hypothetical protein DL93DRAFT_2125174 [Clavulina sp. PMI_390]|nr:hypothetical protein DL93DRAFT_2125174 [Clavulina sp. PMI_390]